MHGINPHDEGVNIDWGKTSADYATYRRGPPPRFYACLTAFDIGLAGQNILDLGTGTGVLARQFASQGAAVVGVDISEGQIDVAKELAKRAELDIEFNVAGAEAVPYPDNSFDVITANQCWLYFDVQKAIAEVKRLLRKDGVLVTSHFSWLPREDAIACASEKLVLKHNPVWSAGDWSGKIPNCPDWAKQDFNIVGMFYFDTPVLYTRESWRGRIRACRGVGAGLNPDQVKQFDREHKQLLREIADDEFSVLHRVDAHILQLKS